MFIERPLASLSPSDATAFVRTTLPPDAADAVLDDLADPTIHTLGTQKVAATWQDAGGPRAFTPFAIYGYCELAAHPIGARIARALPKRFAGPFGFAHSIGIAGGTGVDLEKTIFLALAHAAQIAGHAQLVIITDRVRAERFTRFGCEVLPHPLHNRSAAVAIFDLAARRADAAAASALDAFAA